MIKKIMTLQQNIHKISLNIGFSRSGSQMKYPPVSIVGINYPGLYMDIMQSTALMSPLQLKFAPYIHVVVYLTHNTGTRVVRLSYVLEQ